MSQSSWKVRIYLDLDQISNIWKFSAIDERDKINLDETFYLIDKCPNLSTMTFFFIIMLGNIYKMKVLYILYILLYSNLHKVGQDDNCKQIPLVCFVTIIGRTTPFLISYIVTYQMTITQLSYQVKVWLDVPISFLYSPYIFSIYIRR